MESFAVPSAVGAASNLGTFPVKHESALARDFELWRNVAVLMTDVHQLVTKFMCDQSSMLALVAADGNDSAETTWNPFFEQIGR